MSTLHALLVAINNYPDPRHRLQGCVPDLQAMHTYLSAHCQARDLVYKAQTLLDEQATRANIIAGFQHLAKAKTGDTVVFFYAGHGSRVPAPAAFWHREADRMNETLVCYDSRLEDGRDLIDKELAYLIWSVTHDKDVHFVSITDCCHSGSNMRLEPVGERRMAKRTEGVAAEDYLGFDHYLKAGDDQYDPPSGRYIHLAASQAHETAKEVNVKGQQRGIFTYILLESLQGTHLPLPYTELINRIRYRIRNYMQDQYPVLESSHGEDKFHAFLGQPVGEHTTPYLVSHDRLHGWVVNAGSLQLPSPTASDPLVFARLADDVPLEVTELLVAYAKVQGMDGVDKKQIVPVTLLNTPRAPMAIALASANDQQGETILQEVWTIHGSGLLLQDKVGADTRFLLHAKTDHYYLTSLQDDRPLFKRVPGYSQEAARSFVSQIQQLAKWMYVQELQKPDTHLPLNSLAINLLKGTQAGDLSDAAAAEPVDWREPGRFVQEEGHPTFKLQLRNDSSDPLWVTVLYLGIDYSITNQLLSLQRLAPGEEVWCSYQKKGATIRTIPITLHDTYYAWGLTSAHCYLKIIASNTVFDTDPFNQKGLELEQYQAPLRNIAITPDPPPEDWRAYTIPLEIHRPLATHHLSASSAVTVLGHQIQAPPGFQTTIRLQRMVDCFSASDSFPDVEISPGQFLHPVELGPPQANPQLSALSFYDVKGQESITAETPLSLHFRSAALQGKSVQAYGWYQNEHRFYLLPQTWREQSLLLTAPPPSQTEAEIFTIFFFNVHTQP